MKRIHIREIYSRSEGGHETPEFLRLRTTYDREGRETQLEEYNEEGELLQKQSWAYDEQGRISMERIDFHAEGVYEEHRYQYDEEGRKAKEEVDYTGGVKSYKTFVYNGLEGEAQVTGEQGESEGHEEYEWDEAGNLLAEVIFDEAEVLKEQMVAEYNEQGLKVSEERLGFDGEFVDEWMYEYDAQGHLTLEKRLNEEGYIVGQKEHTYNKSGQKVGEVTKDFANNITISRTYVYNGKGQLVGETRAVNTDEPEAISYYEYNDEGELVLHRMDTDVHRAYNETRLTYFED